MKRLQGKERKQTVCCMLVQWNRCTWCLEAVERLRGAIREMKNKIVQDVMLDTLELLEGCKTIAFHGKTQNSTE